MLQNIVFFTHKSVQVYEIQEKGVGSVAGNNIVPAQGVDTAWNGESLAIFHNSNNMSFFL